ncbi:MAG: sodium-dependent transporter [Bacillota bacterium]|nr:sodium-dependent transporter [Bacillota bacterium]
MENNRGQWNSNLMFVFAAIGSAIGMGNLWGFPYKMGANGGLPFLLIYLVLVVLCGVICMGVEMAIGRKTGQSPVVAMSMVAKKFTIVGWFGVLSAFIIMGFYSVLIGYAVRYCVGFMFQLLVGINGFGGATTGADFFVTFTQDVPAVIFFTFVTLLLCLFYVSKGTEGLEKFNKIGIPGLFLILVGIIIYDLFLPGAKEGYVFMFSTKGMEIAGETFNFFKALRTAGGQMLFSLSLGMGAMITYGSYLGKKESIAKNAWIIPLFDTLAAIFAGMAIFPAVFATGNSVNAGPGLLFITMHDVFTTMGTTGNLIGMFFYLLVIFAGVSSAISLMEVVTSSIIDMRAVKEKKSNRTTVTTLVAVAIFIISIPIAVDQLGLAGDQGIFWNLYSYLGAGSQDLLDFYDMLTEGLMMPLGALLMCVAVGWVKGFDWMSEEVTVDNKTWKCKNFFRVCVKYVAPILMAFVLVSLFLSYLGL